MITTLCHVQLSAGKDSTPQNPFGCQVSLAVSVLCSVMLCRNIPRRCETAGEEHFSCVSQAAFTSEPRKHEGNPVLVFLQTSGLKDIQKNKKLFLLPPFGGCSNLVLALHSSETIKQSGILRWGLVFISPEGCRWRQCVLENVVWYCFL